MTAEFLEGYWIFVWGMGFRPPVGGGIRTHRRECRVWNQVRVSSVHTYRRMFRGMMIDTFPEFSQESEIFRRNVEFEDWGKKLLSPEEQAL